MKDWHSYILLDTSINTIGDFINSTNSLVKSLQKTPNDFIFYEDRETETTNADRIWSFYSEEERETYPNANSLTISSPLKQGTPLMLPKDSTNNKLLFIKGANQLLKQRDFKTFVDENFQKTEDDPRYVRSNVINSISGKSDVSIIQLSLQVWVYVRAIDEIVDITNFVSDVRTNKGKDGNFSISLSPINNLNDLIYTMGLDTVNMFNVYKEDKLNHDWFHKNFQQNDIVFIRFEKLDIEQDRNDKSESLIIPKQNIVNGIWDMIGLIDSNTQSYNPEINSISTNISGRDFGKLLVEDGSYFFPYALVEGSDSFFINEQKDGKILRRLFVSSKFNTLFAYSYKSIRDILGFIFNQLTNVGVLPPENDLFNAYGSTRSKSYEVNGADNDYLREVEQNGVWQIIKLLVDDQLDDRRIVDTSIAQPDGTIQSQINKICQEPFVEFWGDTYGSFFNFIVRQPPFTKSQILDYLDTKSVIEINNRDVASISMEWETEYYSIFQIQPQNNFLGNTNFIAMAHIPVIYFSEYINNFGNHKLTLPTNYVSYQAMFGDKKSTDADLFKKFLANEFKYIIETFSYLPFTRKGSVTIKGGDRRIKRGTWVRINTTGEIGYVDSVSHSLTASANNIDRDTVVQVSRVMKEDNLKGSAPYSYFDVINVDVIEELLNTGLSGGKISKERSQLIVNEKAFDYFLQRKQMD